MAGGDYDPSTALRRIEEHFARFDERLAEIERLLGEINGELRGNSQILKGPTDRAGHHLGGGLVDQFTEFMQATRRALDEQHTEIDSLSRATTGMSASDTSRKDAYKMWFAGAGAIAGLLAGLMTLARLLG